MPYSNDMGRQQNDIGLDRRRPDPTASSKRRTRIYRHTRRRLTNLAPVGGIERQRDLNCDVVAGGRALHQSIDRRIKSPVLYQFFREG